MWYLVLRTLSEAEKKELANKIGADLVKKHGKQKYYSQPQIRKSLDQYGYAIDIHCWAYVLFMNHQNFDAYHQQIGETCDFVAMKGSMLSSVTDHVSDTWLDFDFDLSWLELPDIDLSDIFSFLDI